MSFVTGHLQTAGKQVRPAQGEERLVTYLWCQRGLALHAGRSLRAAGIALGDR